MPNQPNLPISGLRVFTAIVDRGGFTHAAQSLGLTQPTVSQQLKRLEGLVGQPLLDRRSRKLRLTEAGQSLLAYARQILTLNDEAVARITVPNVSGSLRLGLPHEYTISMLPQLVGAFSKSHPDVTIEVECELSQTLLSNLDKYDLIIALHSQSDPSGQQLRREPLAWVSSADYELPPPQAELHVIAAPHPCIYRDTLNHAVAEAGRRWSPRLTSTSYGAVCAAVSTGMGVTVLARSVVPDDLQVVAAGLLPPLPEIDLRWHYDRSTASPAARTFVDFVRERLVG